MEENSYLMYCLRIRKQIFELLKNGKSGHIGGSLSVVEILAVIYNEFIKGKNNRFVFSKGHCELAFYSILFCEEILDKGLDKKLKIFGSQLQGHPNGHWISELDYSPGSLGQGLSFAEGLAINGKEENYKVYTVLGDGELQEGQIWEAMITAPKFQLDNLNVIVDCNGFQLEGRTFFTGDIEKLDEIWKEADWNTVIIENGHDVCELKKKMYDNQNSGRPNVFFANTIKGYGVSFTQNNNEYHGINLDFAKVMQALMELENDEKLLRSYSKDKCIEC